MSVGRLFKNFEIRFERDNVSFWRVFASIGVINDSESDVGEVVFEFLDDLTEDLSDLVRRISSITTTKSSQNNSVMIVCDGSQKDECDFFSDDLCVLC